MIGDTERRCAAVLLRLGGPPFRRSGGPGAGRRFDHQDDLAGAESLARGTVRIMLGRPAALGLIEQGYRGIVVRIPAALRAFIDEG
ncbi:hypothetical protein [Roseiarcus sp.]|uniref:hypothetical protein n=1 Tax=Roseiarcus sp. TaxID=1969460 RepID=UPI003F9B5DB4